MRENVRRALEMWRVIQNPQVEGPVKDAESFYGQDVVCLAEKGVSSLEELHRMKIYKRRLYEIFH